MGNLIKSRLYAIGKKQIDLLAELRTRGYPKLYECQLSTYIKGTDVSPQGDAVRKLIYEILDEWERESEGA